MLQNQMTDQQIIEALIARDERVSKQFFFGNCRPLFLSIIRYVFSYEMDYDEFVNEFYLHLMENDAYRLRQFQGRSTIYQWMKVIAIRYFIAKRDGMIDTFKQQAFQFFFQLLDLKGYCRLRVAQLLCSLCKTSQFCHMDKCNQIPQLHLSFLHRVFRWL